MKIKCPGCASLLQIPDSAAGKVVKCKCGKQLRAPSPKAAAPAAQPSAQTPAQPAPPSAAAPAPYDPFASTTPAKTGTIFDELTDTDLTPVKAVQIPGAKAKVAPPSANASKLLNEAIAGGDRRAEGVMLSGEAPRPPFLIFLGVINWMAALFYIGLVFLFVGLVSAAPAMEGQIPMELAGVLLYLFAIMFGVMGLLSLATGIACFLRGKIAWYVVLVSYGWSLAFNIFDVVLKATGDDPGMGIIKGIGGILVGAAIWFWLHGEDVRDYYQIRNEPIWRTVLFDISGFITAGGLGVAIMLLQD